MMKSRGREARGRITICGPTGDAAVEKGRKASRKGTKAEDGWSKGETKRAGGCEGAGIEEGDRREGRRDNGKIEGLKREVRTKKDKQRRRKETRQSRRMGGTMRE